MTHAAVLTELIPQGKVSHGVEGRVPVDDKSLALRESVHVSFQGWIQDNRVKLVPANGQRQLMILVLPEIETPKAAKVPRATAVAGVRRTLSAGGSCTGVGLLSLSVHLLNKPYVITCTSL
jgi:hypothetical protein